MLASTILDIILLFGIGFGLPIILSFIWIGWMERAKNKFLFLRNYLTATTLLLFIISIAEPDSYLNPSISLVNIVLQNPSNYWYYYVFIVLSLSLLLLFWIPYGRTKTGGRIAAVLIYLRMPYGLLGPNIIFVNSGYPKGLDILTFSLTMFRLFFSIGIGIPQWTWAVVFGKVPATLSFSDKAETDVETLDKQVTKWVVDSLKEMEEDILKGK